MLNLGVKSGLVFLSPKPRGTTKLFGMRLSLSESTDSSNDDYDEKES
jgi:hypothetical protein